jgi:hypothetical protein
VSASPRSELGERASVELGLSAREQLDLVLELLRRGQALELRLGGPCMRPWAFGGDSLRIEPLITPPRPGWVVLVRDGEGLLAHRVLHIANERVWTRGDLSTVPDPPWLLEQVVGRVVSARGRLGVTVPLGGRLAPLIGLAASVWLRRAHRGWRWLRVHAAR